MNSDQEKRRSFRVVESVYLIHEIISDREFQQGLERWKMALGTSAGIRSTLLDIDARFQEKLFTLNSDSVELVECLTLLNTKINTFLDQLPELRESRTALAKQDPQLCEVGADGMVFGADKQYPIGSKIALRLLLAADSRYVETFSHVVRHVDAPDDNERDYPYGVAVEFHGMKPAQKDILIRHMFDRESETLRMRRLNLDAVK